MTIQEELTLKSTRTATSALHLADLAQESAELAERHARRLFLVALDAPTDATARAAAIDAQERAARARQGASLAISAYNELAQIGATR